MKTSGNSSAPSQPNLSASAPSRRRFALTGRSRPFDPLTTAARPDLADVRVADRVFAPHYAAPMAMTVVSAAGLSADRDGPAIAQLAPGALFEALELTATHAWGVAPDGMVGYVARDALAT